MAIQISYTSAEIQAKLDAAGTAVQGDALKGLAATLTAADSTAITSTSQSPADLDDYITPGNYRCGTAAAAATVAHRPDGVNLPFRLHVMETTYQRIRQTMIVNTGSAPGIHVRYYDGAGFSGWLTLASVADVQAVQAASIPEMVMISDFEYISGGWWTASGGFSGTSTLYHSQMIPIIPGGRHYLGYLYSSSNIVGAFFDSFGNWISSLAGTDVTEFPVAQSGSSAAYKTPSGSGSTSGYTSLYYFDAPANAHYFSYNLVGSTNAYAYRQYLSSKPVFMLANSGNYIVRPGDAMYQTKKDKKLCVIGPSSVMIDRFDRSSQGNDTPYVVGYQEYLAPWYAQVDSYGFSGGAMFPASGESATSIYNGIVTAAVDLSGYDEFLISGSTNGLADEYVDDWDSTDTSKYFGALNGIIDYIYTQNATAKIWLNDLSRKKNYWTYADSYRARIDTVIEHTATLAEKRGYGLIPVSIGSECNANTYAAYTYDGVHSNSAGNRVLGLFYRKCMLGF